MSVFLFCPIGNKGINAVLVLRFEISEANTITCVIPAIVCPHGLAVCVDLAKAGQEKRTGQKVALGKLLIRLDHDACGAVMSAMSGSGSTVYGVFRTAEEAENASKNMGICWCRAVKTLTGRTN